MWIVRYSVFWHPLFSTPSVGQKHNTDTSSERFNLPTRLGWWRLVALSIGAVVASALSSSWVSGVWPPWDIPWRPPHWVLVSPVFFLALVRPAASLRPSRRRRSGFHKGSAPWPRESSIRERTSVRFWLRLSFPGLPCDSAGVPLFWPPASLARSGSSGGLPNITTPGI